EEKRQQEEKLREALDKASESDRMKSAFLASMSHEIRTPLNAIVGFSNLITESVEDESLTGFKDLININNDLLLSIIGDVLDFAKIESNTIDLHNGPVDVNEIITSTANTVRFRLQKGVNVTPITLPTPCVTLADYSRLSQVLINLLTNACKFTSSGSIISGCELRDDERTLYFYVKDTGIGIARENLDKIFDQFVKLNSFAQGTGLGLAITKKLVNLMGGEIGAESEGLGFGTTMWFTLPYTPCDVEEYMMEEEKAASSDADNDEEMLTFDEDKPLMLIAEDNMSNYMLLEQILQGRYNLLHAGNGEEAVKMAKRYSPAVILMDIGMPVMDGYEATKKIREFNTDVPIVAVTAYAFSSDRQKVMASGFNGYVTKPVSKKALEAALQQLG
ncbi:MAG: response regulator, partial [Bacteroidaceae bacterium]|nr:response regulator [Bacteroidaceae bacterium]